MAKKRIVKQRISVTPEMIDAGCDAFVQAFVALAPYQPDKKPDVALIYRAMEAARPTKKGRITSASVWDAYPHLLQA